MSQCADVRGAQASSGAVSNMIDLRGMLLHDGIVALRVPVVGRGPMRRDVRMASDFLCYDERATKAKEAGRSTLVQRAKVSILLAIAHAPPRGGHRLGCANADPVPVRLVSVLGLPYRRGTKGRGECG